LTKRGTSRQGEQFRAMLTALTDKEPLIAGIGGGDDVSVSACEFACRLNNHQASGPDQEQEVVPFWRTLFKSFITSTLTGSVLGVFQKWTVSHTKTAARQRRE